jgi:hypothetical protein
MLPMIFIKNIVFVYNKKDYLENNFMSSSTLITNTNNNPNSTTNTNTNTNTNINDVRLPEASTMIQAAKLAMIEDKPIMMDYWVGSIDQTVRVGVREQGEKLLVRNEDEYTSPIAKIYNSPSKTEHIIMTENSIYIVDAKIKASKILGSKLSL